MGKVVVFGGSGFLGSHVADQLSDVGHEVTIFDRAHTSYVRSDQQMICGNLLDSEAVKTAIKGADIVYNFAAIADLNEARDKPLETVRVNIEGNIHILEGCIKHDVQRFFYASTVYAESRDGGFYRCSKQAAESYVKEYYARYGLDYTILRYGSLYGPRSGSDNGLWRIVNQALSNGVLRYEGNPEAMREYIHVVDAARASVAALSDEFANRCVIFTGHEPMRVADLLKMIAEIIGIQADIEFTDAVDNGHYVRTPYAYQRDVGQKYIPPLHVDLGQGLLELIAYIDNESK